jgi:pyruvate/2-oxoglutarate dehydrogenase complex dihydrolipoamide acyltransferase (E2) component
MPERTIKFVSFVWHKKGKDYNGDEITITVDSKQGEVVDLPDNIIRYGESMGAFVTPEDEAAEVESAVQAADMDDDELVNWVSESTVTDIVNVAKSDPALSNRLLEAENTATGNDPRTSLVAGLEQVAGSGEAPPAPTTEDESTVPAEPETAEDAAKRLGVDLAEIEGTGEDDAVTVDDVKEYYDEEMANATDGAIKLAEDKDVYLADVTGSGDDGRISKDDVQGHLNSLETASA